MELMAVFRSVFRNRIKYLVYFTLQLKVLPFQDSKMGSVISSQMGSVMDENMKKQQDFMVKNQQIMMERTIVMQNEMRERQMSMGIARAREVFKYYSGFYGTVAFFGIMGAVRGSPMALVPLVPLSFILGFQYDAAHGTLMSRVREEANSIIKNEHDMLGLPHGLPTFELIEEGRLARKQK